jgi:lysophospholipase L1-like esterase
MYASFLRIAHALHLDVFDQPARNTFSTFCEERHTADHTLLIRGGGIAAGCGVARGYADILRDWCRPKGITLINRSRPGDNSFDGVRSFEHDIAPFRPRLLIIHFGIDDAFGCVYKSEFKENLVRMVRSARACCDPVIIMPTSQSFESSYYLQPACFYYQIIRDVCVDLGCEMVPVHAYWNRIVEEQGVTHADLVQQNVLYPNERGHAIFAKALIKWLEMTAPGR